MTPFSGSNRLSSLFFESLETKIKRQDSGSLYLIILSLYSFLVSSEVPSFYCRCEVPVPPVETFSPTPVFPRLLLMTHCSFTRVVFSNPPFSGKVFISPIFLIIPVLLNPFKSYVIYSSPNMKTVIKTILPCILNHLHYNYRKLPSCRHLESKVTKRQTSWPENRGIPTTKSELRPTRIFEGRNGGNKSWDNLRDNRKVEERWLYRLI